MSMLAATTVDATLCICLVALMFAFIAILSLCAPFDLVVQHQQNEIHDIAWSPDGAWLASAGDDNAKLWDGSGRLIRTFFGHKNDVTRVAFSPDGRWLMTASVDKTVRIWPVLGGEPKQLDFVEPATGIAFLSDTLVVVAVEKKLFGYATNGSMVWHQDTAGAESMALAPNRREIALAGVAQDGEPVLQIFSADGKKLREHATKKAGESPTLGHLSWSPDGSKIVGKLRLSGYVASAFVWYPASLASGPTRIGKPGSAGATVGFAPNGNIVWPFQMSHVVGRGEDEHEEFWSELRFATLTGAQTRKVDIERNFYATVIEPTLAAASVRFNPTGRSIALLYENRVLLADAQGSPTAFLGGVTSGVRHVATSGDGRYVAVAYEDGTVRIWSIDARLLTTLRWPSVDRKRPYFSKDNQRLIVDGGDSKVGIAQAFSLDGRLLHSAEQRFGFSDVFESPDGKRFITLRPGERSGTSYIPSLTFYDESGQKISRVELDNSFVAAIDPAGNVVTVQRKLNRKTDVVSSLVIVIGPDGVVSRTLPSIEGTVVLSPDGTQLITRAGVIDSKGTKLFALPGDQKSAVYSSDGSTFATKTGERVTLYSAADGSPIGSFPLSSKSDLSELTLNATHIRFALYDEIWLFKRDGTLVGKEGNQVTRNELIPRTQLAARWTFRDPSVRLLNLNNDKEVLMVATSDEWVSYTSDGYYDSSPAGGRALLMVSGLTAFGIDQFAVRNNRPDVLLERLQSASPEEVEHFRSLYLKRLRKAGFSEESLAADLHVPVATITAAKRSASSVALSFDCSDDRVDLKRAQMYVNDVPIWGSNGRAPSGRQSTFTEVVELVAGENKIEVSCINTQGAESYRALNEQHVNGVAKGDLYLLAFGVSRYTDARLPQLEFAHKDAQDLAAVMARMPGFSKVITRVFTNEAVTPVALREARSLLAASKPADTLVVFIAGHGLHERTSEATYYFLPTAASLDDLKSSAASFELVEELLQGVPPRSKLLLMDTCESGEVEANVAIAAAPANAKARGIKAKSAALAAPAPRPWLWERDRFIYNDLTRRSGAIVFSASRGGELSWERSDLQNGVFTRAILDGFRSKGADKNGDNRVSTVELRAFVTRQVSAMTSDLQHPTVDRDNLFQRFSFPVIR